MSIAPVWFALALAMTCGSFAALVGAIVFFVTRYKIVSAGVVAAGLVVSAGSLASWWLFLPR